MKNKSYFGIFQKNKKLFKKILISILIVLLIFIPSFLVLINYFSEQDTPIEEDEITVSVYNGEVLLFSETEIRQNALPGSLISIFDSILKGLTDQPAADTDATMPLTITHTKNGHTTAYTCYFFTDASDSNFLVDENGAFFTISQHDALLFLSSRYAQSLYPAATTPKLYTSAEEEITPKSAQWYYKNMSSKYVLSEGIETSTENTTYDMAGALGISFDIEPDECTVDVYKSGVAILKVNGTNLSNITVTPGTVLNFKITATWKQAADSEFYGSIEYDFDAILRDRAEFIVNKTSLQKGDFLILSCTNVLDSSKITFSSTPDIKFLPEYFESNDMVYAVIPFSADLASGMYSLSFNYGASTEIIDIELKPTDANEPIVLTPDKDPYFLNYISNKALSSFKDVLDFDSERTSEHIYFDGAFLDYTAFGATEKYTWGTQFQNSLQTKGYTFYGNVFEFEDQSGVSIKAANNGVIIKRGFSDSIGNFVVLDHGLGIKTVYGHLSAINVQVGDVVLKGQSLGRSGKTNGSDKDSLLILTYLFETSVDYSSIAGKELQLYAPEQTEDK